MATKPPTNELGTPGGLVPTLQPGRTGSVAWQVESLDLNPEFQFPKNIAIYDQMRSDGQVRSVIESIVLTIMRARFPLDTEGVSDEVAQLVRNDIGIDEEGASRRRRRREGITFHAHLQDLIEPLIYAGFMPFEQKYAAGVDGYMHLSKLAPRPPRTITRIETERDGGLRAVYQTNPDPLPRAGFADIELTVDRLVMYTHRKEGADWSGRSILRSAYKYWLIKDVYLRLDAQAAERNSMGVPVFSITSPDQKAEAERVAAEFRAGAAAYVIEPQGTRFRLEGVSGSTMDLTSRLAYLDQGISRSALEMFLDLGHDAGARSLADTFYNVFLDSVQALGNAIADTFTEHVIRDLVEANFGADEPYPVMTCADVKASGDVDPTVLKTLVDAGIIKPDATMETYTRNKLGLPKADTEGRVMDAAEQNLRGTYAQGLIRSGFDPAAAMTAAGLDPVKHLGLLPVTVQPPAAGTELPNAVAPVDPAADPASGAAAADESADDVPFVDGWTDIRVPAGLRQNDPVAAMVRLNEELIRLQARRGHVPGV